MSERKRLGELGQIAFEHHVARHGLTIRRPYGDNKRYDCIVDNDHRLMRVQVKTTRSLRRGNFYEIHTGHRLAPRVLINSNHPPASAKLPPASIKRQKVTAQDGTREPPTSVRHVRSVLKKGA